jgi:hypothetical protein
MPRVQYFRAGTLVEEVAAKAIWELMYFGRAARRASKQGGGS